MFHSRANALIRLAVFPVLLLYWQDFYGTRLPLLGPALVAVLFCISSQMPSTKMILKLGVILFVSTWLQGKISLYLFDDPLIYYLLLFVTFYWCMQRARENPADIVSSFMLLSLVLVTVFSRQKGLDITQLPKGLFLELIYAGFTVCIAFLLFPGGEVIATTQTVPEGAAQTEIWHLLFKAACSFIFLWVFIDLNLSQAALMAITLTNVIKDPNPMRGVSYGINRLIMNSVGLLFALPPLLAAAFEVNIIVQLGIAIVCAMLVGMYAMKKHASNNNFQVLYCGYVILLYKGITESGGYALHNDFIRIGSILFSVMLGLIILQLIQPQTKTEQAS
ncbi:DUF2955 domain-containing protein [Shewanella sp. 30m-9]